MYSNIGGKIKGLAIAVFICETLFAIFASFGLAIQAIDYGELDMFLLSVAVFFFGPLVAWISTWLLYGFGELISKTCDVANNTRAETKKSQTQKRHDVSRIEVLENLRAQGLISETEYQQAVSRY